MLKVSITVYQIDHSTLWWTFVVVNWLNRSAAGRCFGPIIVPPVHLVAFSILENTLIGYADDSNLIAIVPSPGVRDTVAEPLRRDLV